MIRILNISIGKNDEEEEEEGDINDNQQVIDHETHKSFKSGQPPSLWAAPFSHKSILSFIATSPIYRHPVHFIQPRNINMQSSVQQRVT